MDIFGINILWWIGGIAILVIIGIIFWKLNNKIQTKEFKENFKKKMESQKIQQLRKELMQKSKEELIEDYLKVQVGWSLHKP